MKDEQYLQKSEINKKIINCIYCNFEDSLRRAQTFLEDLKKKKVIINYTLFPDFENKYLVWEIYFEDGSTSTWNYSLRCDKFDDKVNSFYVYVKKRYTGNNILKKIVSYFTLPKKLSVAWKDNIEEDLEETFSVNFDDEVAKILGKEIMEGIRELQR
jgi:hypothetical protein